MPRHDTLPCPAWCTRGDADHLFCISSSEGLGVGPDYETTLSLQDILNWGGVPSVQVHITPPPETPGPLKALIILTVPDCAYLGRLLTQHADGKGHLPQHVVVDPWHRTTLLLRIPLDNDTRLSIRIRRHIPGHKDRDHPTVLTLTPDDCARLGNRLTRRAETLPAGDGT